MIIWMRPAGIVRRFRSFRIDGRGCHDLFQVSSVLRRGTVTSVTSNSSLDLFILRASFLPAIRTLLA
jgi:hypothetical protein